MNKVNQYEVIRKLIPSHPNGRDWKLKEIEAAIMTMCNGIKEPSHKVYTRMLERNILYGNSA